MLDNRPDNVEVHCEITVNEAVACSGYFAPGHFPMRFLDMVGHVASCFTNDLQKAYERQSQHLISIQIDASLVTHESESLFNGVQHVL